METNKELLNKAIAALPEYQPPAGLWHDIEAQLDFDQNLDATLPELPEYTPPTAIWEQLATQLDQQAPPPAKTFTAWRWIAVTLALLLTAALVFLVQRPQPAPVQAPPVQQARQPVAQAEQLPVAPAPTYNKRTARTSRAAGEKVQLVTSTEVADDAVMQACQSADDPNYALIDNLCREAAPVCAEPRFKQLKAEFDELSRAHSELKNALGDYADDPDLVAQLVQIEQSRNQILQQLITLM